MKSSLPILVLLCGAGGFLLAGGCATPPKKAASAAAQSVLPPLPADLAGNDLMTEDLADNSPENPGKGSPEALARYAAGVSYEWNDEDVKAVKEFEDAALADPSNEHLVIKLAQRFLKTKQVNRALALVSKSAARPDASALLLSWLARTELVAGHSRLALAASRASIAKDPRALDGYESQVEIYFRANKPAEALRTMNRAVKSLAPDSVSLVQLASLYALYLKAEPADAKAKASAVALMDRIAKMEISSTHIWQTLADTFRQIDEPKRAEEIYLKLLSATPEPSPLRESLHEKLAGIYFQTEDKTNAMKQLEAIVRDNPTRYPRAWFYLGELAYADDKLAEAADDYANALHWDPTIEEAYYKLALVQVAMHQTDEAFRTVDLARGRFPKTFLGEEYTGAVYLEVKKYDDAIRHFNMAEVIALASDAKLLDYRFYYQLGEAYERNQEFAEADKNLQKSVNLSPNFGEGLNYLGYMLADRGVELPRARSLIERAVQLEPTNGAYLDSLAWVLFKEKQPQQALPWLLKAVEVTPEPDATELDHLGEIYMALHQPAKAIEAWKKSLSIESNPEVKKKLDTYSGGA